MSSSLDRSASRVAWARYGSVAALGALALGASFLACGNTTSDPGGKSSTSNAVVAPSPAYVPIARGAHPMARPELDRGPLDPDKVISNLSVAFKLTPAQIADRDALIAAQLDPSSPSYHKWLTPQTYAARFGASPDVIARTTAWLSQQGLTVHQASPLGTRVTFSGRVADLQRAFHVQMRRYEVGGKLHYAMASAPSVPADLADAVLGIHNTHDFFPQPMARVGSAVKPQYKNGFQVGFAPADWANVYDVTRLYTQGVSGTPITGAGVTIAIVGVTEIGQSDIDQFRSKFGLPPNTITMTLLPNTGPAQPGNGGGIEAYLDTEWSGGIAQQATVNYVFTGADDGNVDDATYYIIENNLAGIISESFGGCELGLTPSDADLVAVYGSAAELLGITYLVASGDSGATGCLDFGVTGLYADIPAAYPGVTAVGGSEFPAQSITYDPTTETAEGYSNQEECWNEGNTPPNVGAGAGGISNVFARPSYQAGVPTCTMLGSLPTNVNPANMRMFPDVAVNAASYTNADFIVCQIVGNDCTVNGTNDQVIGIGGTSASAPAFAGVVALLTQAAGGGRLGNINPLLYTLASSNPSTFHDIVNGDNEIECTPGTDPGCPAGGKYGFPATPGYDCATGLGSPDVFNLATAWAALAPTSITLTASPTSTTPGAPVNLNATVDVTTPNASALAGTVRFAFQSYSFGGPDLTWTLGTSAIAGGTVSSGTAAFTGPIPPGLVDPGAQYVDVVAMYGGDANHMASTSAKVRIDFTLAQSFCLVPSLGTIQPLEGFTFTTTGGTPPVQWFTGADSTCDMNNDCSSIDATTGAFIAGPEPGYVVVVGIDSTGLEQVAYLTVGDPGEDAGEPPWGDAGEPFGGCTALPPDAGFTIGYPDAGSDASILVDSGSATVVDSGSPQDGSVTVDAAVDAPVVEGEDAGDAAPDADDAGPGKAGGNSGCGCEVVAGGSSAPARMLAGLGLVLGALVRRRRRSS